MRNAFMEELTLAAETNEKIVLVVGDLGFGVVENFAKRFPRRFFNAGVAEQNMMGLCAGLASEGYHVFAYSIANFPTFRCAEQIRNDVDYHNLSVTVVAVGGGLSYGNLGYSHHAVQDYSLIRSMPNMLIAAPGDPMEVRACMRYLLQNPQPSYLRLGKAGEPNIHKSVPDVSPGKLLEVIRATDKNAVYITTGAALNIVYSLLSEVIDTNKYSLKSMPLWSMKTKQDQIEQLKDYQRIVTLEDHLIDGGFGSWLLESTVSDPDVLRKITIKGLDSKVCGMVAKQSALHEISGFNKDLLCR